MRRTYLVPARRHGSEGKAVTAKGSPELSAFAPSSGNPVIKMKSGNNWIDFRRPTAAGLAQQLYDAAMTKVESLRARIADLERATPRPPDGRPSPQQHGAQWSRRREYRERSIHQRSPIA